VIASPFSFFRSSFTRQQEERSNTMATRTASNLAAKPVEQELVITRMFNATREQVWKAWTDPDIFMRWWGPKGFTAPFCTIDLRVGGKYINCMRSPEGQDYWSTGTYQEIVPLKRIVCTDSFADEKGNVVPATHYNMSPDFPLEMLIAVTFEEQKGKTRLFLRHIGIPLGHMRDLTEGGWNESFDKLAAELAKAGS
jgi:uncharacterized protein YndB with AHSA1/START domain